MNSDFWVVLSVIFTTRFPEGWEDSLGTAKET